MHKTRRCKPRLPLALISENRYKLRTWLKNKCTIDFDITAIACWFDPLRLPNQWTYDQTRRRADVVKGAKLETHRVG